MKVRSALKLLCTQCFFVRRRQKLYVMCKRVVKHKQRQGFATFSNARGALVVGDESQSPLGPAASAAEAPAWAAKRISTSPFTSPVPIVGSAWYLPTRQ